MTHIVSLSPGSFSVHTSCDQHPNARRAPCANSYRQRCPTRPAPPHDHEHPPAPKCCPDHVAGCTRRLGAQGIRARSPAPPYMYHRVGRVCASLAVCSTSPHMCCDRCAPACSACCSHWAVRRAMSAMRHFRVWSFPHISSAIYSAPNANHHGCTFVTDS